MTQSELPQTVHSFSLRRRLLWWMALPLLAFVLLDAWASYQAALATAQKAFDRLLVTAAHSLGDMIRLERGQLQVSMPHAALELYSGNSAMALHDQPGRSPLLYRVGFLNGEFLAGDEGLPAYAGLPPLDSAYASRLQFYDGSLHGMPTRFVALWQPVESAEGMRYVVVQVGEYSAYRYALGRSILWETLVRQGGLLVLLLIALWIVATMAMRPMRRLAQTVAERSPEDLRLLQIAPAPQELHPLLHAFNGLLTRMHAAQVRQQRFVADASHQLRTPLAVLQLHAEAGLQGDVPMRDALQSIHATTRRTSRAVHQLLMWNRVHTDGASACSTGAVIDIRGVMQEVAVELSPLMAQQRVDFEMQTPPMPANWSGAPWMLEEILKNLLTNAVQHTPMHGHMGMQLYASDRAGQKGWEIRVWNSGQGLASQVAAAMFTPFVTGGGQGVGLGLAICRDLALACGGTLHVANAPADAHYPGVWATLWLPATEGDRTHLNTA